MSHNEIDAWMIGVFGILGMVFFIGCTSCWQYKSSHPSGRRHPPPPPSPNPQPRYEHGPYPQNPPPEAAANLSVPQKSSTNNADSEEEFEECWGVSKGQKADVKGQKPQKSAKDSGARQDTYVNLDAVLHYENLPDPAVNEDHVYLKILKNNHENEMTEVTESKTPRSAINSIGKYSSHSDSLCHSYENVAMEGPAGPLESDLDYVNVSPSQ
ncbi:uncharacterized protein ACNLHF_025745 [Anomaloglossus baeobatrachus]|uniref:uncharacterized protein LOC142245635 n=1 Tax=Anomaloglossus baeobatrachus TaxID=238106 RepID=UPI003F4F7142